MFEVYNTITGEFANVLSETPYELAGPLAERKTKQKTDEQGNLLYLDLDGNETDDSGYETVIEEDENMTPVDWEWHPYQPVVVDTGPVYEWREIIPTPAEIASQIQTELTNAVQAHMDNTAKLKGYDGILSAASYAALPVGEPFQAEGVAYALWRSAVWVKCYEILAQVQTGTRGVPTVDELLAELPEVG